MLLLCGLLALATRAALIVGARLEHGDRSRSLPSTAITNTLP
jgi:hypothetical protein